MWIGRFGDSVRLKLGDGRPVGVLSDHAGCLRLLVFLFFSGLNRKLRNLISGNNSKDINLIIFSVGKRNQKLPNAID